MKSPYFYIIKHLPSEKYYAGCKINFQSDSSNLMTENGYKTTSKIIKDLIKKDGLASFQILKIKHFKTKMEALTYESRFLQKVNAAENLKFLNLHNGGKNFVNKGGYKLSECTKNKMKKPKSIETVQKQNEQKRNRPKEVYQKMVQTRKGKNPNWHNEKMLKLISSKNAIRWKNEKNRKEQSDRMKEYYKNNPISEDTRKKLKLANSKENNNMFGKKHTDSTKEKMKLAWLKRKENKKTS
jgi:hypothetical protein